MPFLFDASTFNDIWNLNFVPVTFSNNRGRNKFCLTGDFCCWRNQIAVHLLQVRALLVQYVSCFVHLSLEAFPISAIRKCLICRKSTFSHLFYSIFSLKIPSCILAPNTLEIQTRLRLTLSQSQHFKRLLNAIAHKHSIKYNPFIYILYIKSKISICS